MLGSELKTARLAKGWTQQQAASRLNISQPYLSLLEQGSRTLPADLARKFVTVYGLAPTVLPVRENAVSGESSDRELAEELGALGYPGFSHMRGELRRNPAEVLLAALKERDLDRRVVEGLPWVVATFPDLDWHWLVPQAKIRDLQNRLGFVTSVAGQLRRADHPAMHVLSQQERVLYESRLAREDTLCHDSMTETERRWLRAHRAPEAAMWNLLTDLSAEHLSHVT